MDQSNLKKQIRILVAEDNEDDIFFLRNYLSYEDFDLTILGDGLAAYKELMIPNKFDVALLDNHLPTMTGIEILEKLGRSNLTCAIVFLTVGNSTELAVQAMKAGAMDFRTKSRSMYKELPFIINNVHNLYTSIMEKRNLNKQIKAALEEKETLLKEVHHRVKNNLQVIYSLISLQVSKIDDDTAKEQINSLINRIHSMALVHEKLYVSPELSHVNFREYIEDLSNMLRNIYKSENEVIFEISSDDVFINIEEAVPCGLIINELISNALKYAFPKNVTGEIKISFIQKGNSYILKIEDDGVGFPDTNSEIDYSGLQLVELLANQLKGTLKREGLGKNKFTLIFSRGIQSG